jgi:hypothetical protein
MMGVLRQSLFTNERRPGPRTEAFMVPKAELASDAPRERDTSLALRKRGVRDSSGSPNAKKGGFGAPRACSPRFSRIALGQFVISSSAQICIAADIGWANTAGGSGLTAATFDFNANCVPAPGAIALLALAGLAHRRKR